MPQRRVSSISNQLTVAHVDLTLIQVVLNIYNRLLAANFFHTLTFYYQFRFVECPGYSAALTRIRAANSDRSWMTKVANQQFNIIEMKFNPTAVDPATGGFKDVQVKVHLFGKDLSFTVNQPVNPYLPHIAGPVIAQMALGLFKSAA